MSSLDLKYEEDVETAVAIVTSELGKPGRMLPTGVNVEYNVFVVGPRKTRLWYGDFDLGDDMLKVHKAEKRLGFPLVISRT